MIRTRLGVMLLSICCFSGCGPEHAQGISACSMAPGDPALKPGQCHAETIAWREVMGEMGQPPSIRWGDSPISREDWETPIPYDKCFDENFRNNGKCAWGVMFPDTWNAYVFWGGSFSVSDTYQHELLHAHLFNKYGDADPTHGRPEWREVIAQVRSRYFEEKL